jgi:hypothetical protein
LFLFAIKQPNSGTSYICVSRPDDRGSIEFYGPSKPEGAGWSIQKWRHNNTFKVNGTSAAPLPFDLQWVVNFGGDQVTFALIVVSSDGMAGVALACAERQTSTAVIWTLRLSQERNK